MPIHKDYKNKKFGKLRPIGYLQEDKNYYWICLCDCGKETKVRLSNLISGNTKSCGCIKKEIKKPWVFTHNLSKTRFYKIWQKINERCKNKNNHAYNRYGERGIKNLWKSFEDFRDDMYESYLEHCEKFGEKQTTIDRIDNSRNYCKENCRWATYIEQENNKDNNVFITFENKTLTVSQWAKEKGFSARTLFERLKRGVELNKLFLKIK